MANLVTQVPIPNTPMVVPNTGVPVKAWFDFFTTIWLRTGGNTADASILLDNLGAVRGGMLARFATAWAEFEATVANTIPVMNPGGATDVQLKTISQLLDLLGLTAPGDILFRGAAGWQVLAPSTDKFLKSNGAADPSWADPLPEAWTAYVPVITANAGAFTTVAATGKYVQIGKTVTVQIVINITTNGTAANFVIATLPVNQVGVFPYYGRANNVSGKMLQGIFAAGGSIAIFNYDGTYPGADGEILYIAGTYETP